MYIATGYWFWFSLAHIKALLLVPRYRRFLIFLLVVIILLLYLAPSWFNLSPAHISVNSPSEVCVQALVSRYSASLSKYDAILTHNVKTQTDFLPFVGNGYLGVHTQGSPGGRLYVRNSSERMAGMSLSVPVEFYPIISININGYPAQEATVLDLKSGIVETVQCYQVVETCVETRRVVYAHRTRPSVIVQELYVTNPTVAKVTLDLRQVGVSGWQGSKLTKTRLATGRHGDIDVETVTGEVMDSGTTYKLAVTNTQLPESVTVKPATKWSYTVLTAVRYSSPLSTMGMISDVKSLSRQSEEDVTTVMNIEAAMLRKEHTAIWNQMWLSGFGISQSLAAGALNGDHINSTMYYVASQCPMPSYELGMGRQQDAVLAQKKLLYFPDRCYDGHQTLQNPKMWSPVYDDKSLRNVVTTWLITLDKHGCAQMLKAGAEGVLQAMMLSFGAMKFSDHLEFRTEPKELHRDYFFRRINYGNNTHVNISVIVGDDNRANLFVALDRNDKPYYACDAGCLDPPVKLSNEQQQFPVKLTEPFTAILYVTHDKQHMEELKHAIHVKEIGEAPAHEHHVMALHRHGHHYGGLPMLFWVSIGFLILIFHLFLFKLIYNEYYSSTETRYVRGKYNL